MQKVIINPVDLAWEACAYLEIKTQLILNNEQVDPRSFIKRYAEKYGCDLSEFNDIFENTIKLYDTIDDEITISKEDLKFYFSKEKEDILSVSKIILLYQNIGAPLAGSLYASFTDIEPDVPVNSLEDLIDLLNKSSLDETDKWRCVDLYSHFDLYKDKLFILIDPVLKKLQKNQSLIDSIEYDWKKRFKLDEDPNHVIYYLAQSAIVLDSKAFYVTMSIFNFNSISISQGNVDGNYRVVYGSAIYELQSLAKRSVSSDILIGQLKGISDANRLQILFTLKDRSLCGQEIAEMLSLTAATVSHHMNALINLHLINIEKKGNRLYYSTKQDDIQNFINQLQTYLIKK